MVSLSLENHYMIFCLLDSATEHNGLCMHTEINTFNIKIFINLKKIFHGDLIIVCLVFHLHVSLTYLLLTLL